MDGFRLELIIDAAGTHNTGRVGLDDTLEGDGANVALETGSMAVNRK